MTDKAIHRLQNLPSFHVETFDAEGRVIPWFTVEPGAYAESVVLNPSNLQEEVTYVSVQILEWGRIAARAQRVWEARERLMRVWKAERVLELRDAVGGDGKPVKLTVAQLEATYRTDPIYSVLSEKIETAAETLNCANAMLEAYRAKRDMAKAFAVRTRAGMNLSTD